MEKFNQAEFESEAKKLVVSYYHYYADEADEKDVFMVWFSKVGPVAKAMLGSHLDCHYFEITYYSVEGRYVVDVYDLVACKVHNEEDI